VAAERRVAQLQMQQLGARQVLDAVALRAAVAVAQRRQPVAGAPVAQLLRLEHAQHLDERRLEFHEGCLGEHLLRCLQSIPRKSNGCASRDSRGRQLPASLTKKRKEKRLAEKMIMLSGRTNADNDIRRR